MSMGVRVPSGGLPGFLDAAIERGVAATVGLRKGGANAGFFAHGAASFLAFPFFPSLCLASGKSPYNPPNILGF